MTRIIIKVPEDLVIEGREQLTADLIPILPASKIGRGTFADARIPPTIARLNDVQAAIAEVLDGNIDPEHTHPLATETEPGLMSPEDKLKLNYLEQPEPINGLEDVPGLLDALLSKANESDFSASIRYIDELGIRVNDVERIVAAVQLALASKAPIQHRHSVSDIDGLASSAAAQSVYAFFRFNHEATGEIRRIERDGGDTSYQANGITHEGTTFTINEAGIYIATIGGRLSSYASGAQFNLYVEHNGVRAITSVNTYCATIPLKCVATDTVRFATYSTVPTTMIGSLSLQKIA